MRRVLEALREWCGLRVRVREELAFHLDQAAAKYQGLGLGPLEAHRAARGRCSRRHVRTALHEVGGDLTGLLRLMAIHRVTAWPGFQVALLLAAGIILLMLSPSARTLGEAVAGRPFSASDRKTIFISKQARNLTYVGLTPADFEALGSISDLTGVERHLGIHARAHVVRDTPLSTIELALQARTHNRDLRILPLYDRSPIVMGPSRATWAFLWLWGICSLKMNFRRCRKEPRWSLYVLATGALHCATSMLLWAFAMQLWTGAPWSTDGWAALALLVLLLGYVGSAVVQIRWWIRDLNRRCPVCLDGLLLWLAAGSEGCLVLNSLTKESICAHGHGVLEENRWARGFRAQRSPLAGIIRA